jgi:LPS O-antigen subunit length determinant protein (WzzB/FepE family)
MELNKKISKDDEIDLRVIFSRLLKDKFLILIVTLVFAVTGYIYSAFQPKLYEARIGLRDAPDVVLDKYRAYLEVQQQQQQQQKHVSIILNYNKELKLNLLSLDNLTEFAEKNEKIDEFKSYLKTRKIDVRDYFKNKFKAENPKNFDQKNIYTLIFSNTLLPQDFLYDYIIYTKQKTESAVREELTKIIINNIKIYNQNLEIAKKINLQASINLMNINNDYNSLFYKGVEVLKLQIFHLNELLEQTKDLTLDYNPISEKASITNLAVISPLISIIFASILGLFCSFIYIFFKSVTKIDDKS